MPAPADPIPQLIALLKSDRASILTHGHKEVTFARAPARLDVMGGVTDSTGGLIAVMPLDAAAAVAVQRRDDRKLFIKTYNAEAAGAADAAGGGATVELSLDDFYGSASLLPNATLQNLFTGGRHWAAYIAGAFPILAKHKKFTRRTHGANIACFSNVPFGVGLGSSAAVATAALFALTDAFHLILDPVEIAQLAQKLEHHIVGTPRGIMDQAASVLGKGGQLLLMKCQPHEVQGYLPVPEGFLFAGISTGARAGETGVAYHAARVSAFMAQMIVSGAYRDFGQKKDPTGGYLANVPLDMYAKYFRALLPEKISGKDFLDRFAPAGGSWAVGPERKQMIDAGATYEPRAVAEHHIYENARTAAFVNHLRALAAAGDVATRKSLATAAGQLMLESHASTSCLLKLGSEATDVLVELAMKRGAAAGIYGARIMGTGVGGGGGATVGMLAENSPEGRDELGKICEEYEARMKSKPGLMVGSSAWAAESAAVRVVVTELSKG